MRVFAILCCVLLAAAAYGGDSEREESKPEMTATEASDARGDSSEREKSESEATTPDVFATSPRYIPPRSIGAPRSQIVGGGVRSTSLSAPTLYSLVPQHTGRTVSSQPSLFWYVSTVPSDATPVYFTLTNEREIDPIAEIRLPTVSEAGIQRLDLAQHGIKLERGTEYEWTVAVVIDPEQRSSDVVTVGWVMVVDEPAGLEPSARSYAAHGLWYDAMAAASDDLRADLLREVGLGEILDRTGSD